MPRVKELKAHYMHKDIGRKIDAWRVYRNMTQSELAEMVDMSQQNLSRKIRCNSFTYSDLIKLIKALRIPEKTVLEWMIL